MSGVLLRTSDGNSESLERESKWRISTRKQSCVNVAAKSYVSNTNLVIASILLPRTAVGAGRPR